MRRSWRRPGDKEEEYMIELSGIRKEYSGPVGPIHALKGVDLSVKAGEIFGIIGKSGAGKVP
jgi:D-methionine transport system ATP-binding protein